MDSVYGLLCDLLESNSPFVMGEDGCNVPKIVRMIAEILHRKCLADTSETRGRLINLVKMIQNSPDMFKACVADLPPDLFQSLQTALAVPS